MKTQRRGSIILIAALVLFLVFFALMACQLYLRGQPVEGQADLQDELRRAVVVDEASPATNAGWPQWFGPRRDGAAPTDPLLTDWPKSGPRVLWTKPAGEGYSSLAAHGGRVYTILRPMPENGQESVVCCEAATGNEIWRRDYDCPNPPSEFGPGPRSTPCLDQAKLYSIGATGLMHCLDGLTGAVIWKHDLLNEFNAKLPHWGVACSPLVEGNLVLCNPGGPNGNSIVAFDKITGEVRWKALDDPASYSSPIAITAAGKRQILFFTTKGLVSLSPEGEFYWRHSWETFADVNAATPLAFKAKVDNVDRDYVFITSGYQTGCCLLRITADAGGRPKAARVYQSKQMCSHFSSPVRRGNCIYGFNESTLTCFDLTTGEIRWKKNGFKKGSLIRADDKLVIYGEDGILALTEASPEDYHELARARPSRSPRCWVAPALSDGLLFLRDQDAIRCLDLRKK